MLKPDKQNLKCPQALVICYYEIIPKPSGLKQQ